MPKACPTRPQGRYHAASNVSARTAVGAGAHACGDPHRLGIRPAWVGEAGMPTLSTRFHPQRLENRVVYLGRQTPINRLALARELENRVIRLGCQTAQE